MSTRRLPDDVRQAIADAIRAGGKRNQIARDFNVSPGTVSNIATEFNIPDSFDRAATKKATAAGHADLAARLIAQASRNAGVAEQILASFEAMDIDDWRQVSAHSRGIVLGILQDKTMALSPPNDGHDDAKSMLGALADGLRTMTEMGRRANEPDQG